VSILALVALASLASPTPSPTPTASPPIIASVRVATGSSESLHSLPVAASLLTMQQIDALAGQTGDEALRYLPGFDRTRSNSSFTNYGQMRVSFSGAGTDRGLVLADGLPAQDGFGGQIDWTAYPSADLVGAELLRGPGSALYGSGAIGGVLALQTFSPAAPPQTSFSISAGSHDDASVYARASVALNGKLATSFSYAQAQLSYDDLAPGYQAPDDQPALSQTSMASFGVRYAASPSTSITYGYRGAWDDQQEGRPNYEFWRNVSQNAVAFAQNSLRSSFTLRTYERNAFVTNIADMYPSKPGTLLYTQYVPSHETGAFADWTAGTDDATFAARAYARFVGGVADQYAADGVLSSAGSGTQTLDGLALQETLRGPNAELVAGLSGDSVFLANESIQKGTTVTPVAARTDRALTPRAAARYDITKHLAVRLSAGDGFRAPYLNELLRGYQIGATKYLPNPLLVPERSSSLTGGLDWALQKTHVAVDYIHTFVNDAIDFVTIAPNVQIRSNISHTQTSSFTADAFRAISRCTSVDVFATYNNARITDGPAADIGKYLPYVPLASVTASTNSQVGATLVGVSASYLGMTYADDLNQQPLGTATTLGAHAAFPLRSGAQLVLNADNITDARYLSSVDRYAPPQVISLTFRTPLSQPSAPTCNSTP
jgi:iron complex outermembrane recepter protein